MTYLSGVVQDWFEVALQQEDLGYAQLWPFTWHLFVEELWVHFGLSNPVGDAANLIDNLRMKPGDKIATYNMEFIWYTVSQMVTYLICDWWVDIQKCLKSRV